MAVNLKVNPDVLMEKAGTIESEIKQIEKSWHSIENTLNKTKNYWKGDASDMHQRYYKENKEDVGKLIKRLKEQPKDLLEMAGLYRETEQSIENKIPSLPNDIIS